MNEIEETPRLAECLWFEPPDRKAARLARFTAGDWEAALRQGERRGLLPLLHGRLSRLERPPAGLSVAQLETLKRSYLTSVARNLIRYRALDEIVRALGQAGIPVILLKGAHLARWVYADIGLRPMGDLDLLLRRGDLHRAAEVMVAIGYRAERAYDLDGELSHHHHLPPYIGPGAVVELHAVIASPLDPLRVDTAGLWQRSAALPGTTACGLCAEDLALHLALHLLKDEFSNGLRIIHDLATVLDACGERLDAAALSERARSWGLGRGLFLALHLAQTLFGAPLPAGLLDDLRPADFTAEIAALGRERALVIHNSRDAGLHPDVARLLRDRPPGEKLQRLWLALWPHPEYVAHKYNLSPGSRRVYAYYFVRWFDMAKMYGGQLLRLSQADPMTMEVARQENLLSDWCRDLKAPGR